MRSEKHLGRYWFVLGSVFACATAFFLFAVALILQVFAGHGSHAGNILRVGLAIFALFIGCFLVTAGALYRVSCDDTNS